MCRIALTYLADKKKKKKIKPKETEEKLKGNTPFVKNES